jgi:integrase
MKGYLRERDRSKDRRARRCTRWQLVVDLPVPPGSKRRQRFVQFQGTKTEAQAALRRLVVQVESGLHVHDEALTVSQIVERYIEQKRASKREQRTIESYDQLYRCHIKPRLGALRLSRLTPTQVQLFVDELSRSGRVKKGGSPGLSSNSVRQVYNLLKAALRRAQRLNLVATNSAGVVELPQAVKFRPEILNVKKARLLIEAARSTRLFLVILIAALTGARRGEILALSWRDVDEEGRRIRIGRSLERDTTLKDPKTDAGYRRVPIPGELLALLRSHRELQEPHRILLGSAYDHRDLVFCNDDGSPWKPDSIGTLYRAIVLRSGVGHVRLHDIRHSTASILIAAGVPITTVSKLLGHADVYTTLRIYAHAFEEDDAAILQYTRPIAEGGYQTRVWSPLVSVD